MLRRRESSQGEASTGVCFLLPVSVLLVVAPETVARHGRLLEVRVEQCSRESHAGRGVARGIAEREERRSRSEQQAQRQGLGLSTVLSGKAPSNPAKSSQYSLIKTRHLDGPILPI